MTLLYYEDFLLPTTSDRAFRSNNKAGNIFVISVLVQFEVVTHGSCI
jgi:hypothetical protein